MRSISRWMLAAALAVSIGACSDSEKPNANEQRVVVFFTTDEHSQLLAYAPEKDDFYGGGATGTGQLVGGVTRRLAILERERAAAQSAGKDTLTLSSGDFSQGSLASAAWLATSPELRLMKKMGYDAVALGNHEFDLGPAALAGAVGAAATAGEVPPLVLTNLFFSSTSPADDVLEGIYGTGAGKLVAPWRVLTTAHGLRIGIVASMGVEAGTVAGAAPPVTFWSAAATTNQQKFLSIAAAVQGAVDELRQHQDVDAVILLAHGGIGQNAATAGEDEQLAQLTHGIDLVLSGHSHLRTETPRTWMLPSGTSVTLVQPRPYGKEIGKIELVFRDDLAIRAYADAGSASFLPVDDRTAPTTDAAFKTTLTQLTVGFLEAGLPTSFLEQTLTRILGTPVTAPVRTDPSKLGELYFRSLGKLDFDVVGVAPGETAAMNLDTDALLAAAAEFHPGVPTPVAIQASGPIRGDLRPGSTGDISFADLYHLVPLGGDPTVPNPAADPNALPGYPLVRANIPTAGLRAALEQTLQTALVGGAGDFFLGVSGLKVKFDMTRTPFDATTAAGPLAPGWITFMAIETGAAEIVLYDPTNPAFAATGGFAGNPLTMVTPVATTLYVASFASSFGVPMFDDTGAARSPAELVLRRSDGTAVKDYEALGKFVVAQCEGNTAHPGFLPSRYDATTPEGALPNRVLNCTGSTSGACAQ